jgi:sporulation protein YabP
MAIDDKHPVWRHQITLIEREEVSVDGVRNLGSYDEKEVVMETEMGLLIVRGEGLNIKQLNLEKGNIILEGLVKGMQYDDGAHNKKGLLDRFLK